MVENFQDNVVYGSSTLAVSGDAVAIGSTDAGAKSVIFNNSGSQGHLAWQPSANHTINLPDSGGTIQLTGQVPGAIQAGTQTATSGTVIFSNSNGVTFGMSNSSVITASFAGGGGGIAAQAGTQTATSGTVIFSNSNGMTFGMSNSSVITGSYTVPSIAGLISGVNISAGTTSNNLSALTFSNSNGLAFGLNGSTITGSYTVPTQSAQTQSLIQAVYDGANSITTGTIRFTNANGVSFSINGQIISGSVAAQTAQTIGLYALGNTTQNSSTTLDARTLSFNGLGIVTAGYSNGSIQISATQSNQTEGRYALGNTTGQSSSSTFDARTLSISGVGNVSVGYSNNALVISGGGGGGSVNISAGTTSNNLTNFVFSNSNNVSFGLNGSTVTATITVPAQTVQTIGLYAVSNTTQNSSTTLDARTLSFQGAGVASVGYSNGSVVISVPSGGGAGDGVNIIAAGTQTANTTGSVLFSNSNGISFGMSNSSVVTASYTVPTQTNQSIGFFATGNTTQNSSTTLDARSLTFNGLGNVSVGYSNGSVQISGAGGGGGVALYDGANSITSGTAQFSNSNGMSFGFNGQTITASFNGTLGSVVFSNANNITFGSAGSTTITASFSQSNQNLSLFALGNTTQNSSTNLGANVLSLNGLGIITAGYSNGSIQISATQSNQNISFFALGNTTQNSSTTRGAGSISLNGLGIITVGYSNGSIQLSATQSAGTVGLFALGNTTQNSSTTMDIRSLSFNGLGNITVGFSNSSIQISGAGGGGGGVALSAGTNSTSTGTVIFSNSNNMTFGMDTNGVVTGSFAGTNTASTFVLGISTQGNSSGTTGFANQSVQLVGSNGITLSQSINGNSATITILNQPEYTRQKFNPFMEAVAVVGQHGQGSFHVHPIPDIDYFQMDRACFDINFSNATNSTGTVTITMNAGLYTRNASTLRLLASASTTQSAIFSGTVNSSLVQGGRVFTMGWTTTISKVDLWLGIASSTQSGGANASISQYMVSDINSNFSGVFGLASNASNQDVLGLGYYSAATAGIPNSIAFSDLRGTASLALRPPLYRFLSGTA